MQNRMHKIGFNWPSGLENHQNCEKFSLMPPTDAK